MMTLDQTNKNGRVHGKVALVTGGARASALPARACWPPKVPRC